MSKNNFGIDPRALERAAEALREINASPHGALALQSIIKQEESKKAEYEFRKKNKEVEKIKVEQEEKRKSIQAEIDSHKERARYVDKLDRKRYSDKLAELEKMNVERREKDEVSTEKQEVMKRNTIEFEYNKKKELEEKKSEFEAKKLSKIQRDNHDLEIKNIKLREEERRKTLKELFTLNLDLFSNGFKYLLDNKRYAINLSIYLSLMTAGFYLSKSSILMSARYLESKFGKPSLIRETSRLHYKEFYKLPMKLAGIAKNRYILKNRTLFNDIILDEKLKFKLKNLSYSILNNKKNFVPLRNIMFYGPPGTGKTLFAKKLAYYSGLEFAILTGADISPLKSEAVPEIHKVFDWAKQTQKGTILFIDEADAFFRKRDSNDENMSETLRNAINAFLYRTGTPSDKFMFIIATNTPQQLDTAIYDRTDQLLAFNLPSLKERIDIIYLYLVKYCEYKFTLINFFKEIYMQPLRLFIKKKYISLAEDIDESAIFEIAEKIEGFSAREIEKMIILCHDAAFTKDNPIIDKNLFNEIVNDAVLQHEQRNIWEK